MVVEGVVGPDLILGLSMGNIKVVVEDSTGQSQSLGLTAGEGGMISIKSTEAKGVDQETEREAVNIKREDLHQGEALRAMAKI